MRAHFGPFGFFLFYNGKGLRGVRWRWTERVDMLVQRINKQVGRTATRAADKELKEHSPYHFVFEYRMVLVIRKL